MKNTRYGIQRYLAQKHVIDIIKDREFTSSNKMFLAMSVQLKCKGLGGIDHYPPIEEDTLKKIYDSLDVKDPVSLQQKVFVDVMLYFGWRGQQNLRELKKVTMNCQEVRVNKEVVTRKQNMILQNKT